MAVFLLAVILPAIRFQAPELRVGKPRFSFEMAHPVTLVANPVLHIYTPTESVFAAEVGRLPQDQYSLAREGAPVKLGVCGHDIPCVATTGTGQAYVVPPGIR